MMTATQIVRILSRKLGTPRVSGSERNYECPKCGKPGKHKLGVNLSKRLFHCFRCAWSGPIENLLAHIGVTNAEYIYSFKQPSNKSKSNSASLIIPGFVRFGSTINKSNIQEDALYLCWKRGKLDPTEVRTLGWGYSTSSAISGRLIIPVEVDGELVQYLARAIYDFTKPKELSGPAYEGWHSKNSVIYGKDFIEEDSHIVIVEGVWDYFAVRRTGLNAVALMGTNISDEQTGHILSKHPSRITILFDGDDAGIAASKKSKSEIRKRFRDVRIANTPIGKDPDELTGKEIVELVKL